MHLNPWREARQARQMAVDMMNVGVRAQMENYRLRNLVRALHRNLGDLLDVAEGDVTDVLPAIQIMVEARRVHLEVQALGDVPTEKTEEPTHE